MTFSQDRQLRNALQPSTRVAGFSKYPREISSSSVTFWNPPSRHVALLQSLLVIFSSFYFRLRLPDGILTFFIFFLLSGCSSRFFALVSFFLLFGPSLFTSRHSRRYRVIKGLVRRRASLQCSLSSKARGIWVLFRNRICNFRLSPCYAVFPSDSSFTSPTSSVHPFPNPFFLFPRTSFLSLKKLPHSFLLFRNSFIFR